MAKNLWVQMADERGTAWRTFIISESGLFISGLFFNIFEVGEPFNLSAPFAMVFLATGLGILITVLATIFFFKILQQKKLVQGRAEAAMSFIFVFIGLTFWLFFAIYQINIRFDRSLPVAHSQTIRGKFQSHGKGPHSDHIWIDDWQGTGGRYVDTDAGTFYKAQKGDTLVATTRSGYLGYEWIEKFEIQK